MEAVIYLVVFAFLVQSMDWLYHRHEAKAIGRIGSFRSLRELGNHLRNIGVGAKPFDNVIGLFPFLSTWALIIAAVLVSWHFHLLWITIMASLFISSRMRALQEIGHFATHGTLLKNKRLGLTMTNLFCQYPLFLASASRRQVDHCASHHRNAGIAGKDPNIDEFLSIGFKPKISKAKFASCLFYPISHKGIMHKCSRIRESYSRFNAVRITITCLLIVPILLTGRYWEFTLLYLIPAVVIYPQLAWLSQIVEHRWFVEDKLPEDRYARELIIGRPTFYRGILGRLIKFFLFPFGDSYHLAHSLFQFARYNYLKSIDMVLSNHAEYMRNASEGLILKHKKGVHSAVSELMERML